MNVVLALGADGRVCVECLMMANVKTLMESQTLIQCAEDYGSVLLNLKQLQKDSFSIIITAEVNWFVFNVSKYKKWSSNNVWFNHS